MATGPATLAAHLASLVLANPADATLATDAARAGSDLSAAAVVVGPALTQTRIDLATLSADLAS